MGTKELGINTKEKLLKGKKWKQFKNVYPIYSDINFDTFINESGATIHQDKLIQHDWWSVTTQKHINYVANELGLEIVKNYE